jgi:hypothetical protein
VYPVWTNTEKAGKNLEANLDSANAPIDPCLLADLKLPLRFFMSLIVQCSNQVCSCVISLGPEHTTDLLQRLQLHKTVAWTFGALYFLGLAFALALAFAPAALADDAPSVFQALLHRLGICTLAPITGVSPSIRATCRQLCNLLGELRQPTLPFGRRQHLDSPWLQDILASQMCVCPKIIEVFLCLLDR